MLTEYLKGTDLNNWWEAKRWEYNKGLLISGAFSLVFAWLAMSLEASMYLDIIESIAIIIVFLMLYYVFIGAANLLYYLGYTIDSAFNTTNDDDVRHILFTCGYWLSVLIVPVIILVYIAMLIATVPEHSYQCTSLIIKTRN